MNSKISVITVVYNGEETLESTIQSVINQTYINIEYIIIDGGSTDKTIDIITKYKRNLSIWVSEKDKGIFDAMNKGLNLATGEWIVFMNSGDQFYNKDILMDVFNKSIDENIALIYGNVCLFDDLDLYYFKSKTNKIKINLNAICHQSTFIKRTLHPKFDLNYKLSADHNLIYDFVKKFNCLYLDKVIAKVLIGGVSSNLRQTRKEKLAISLAKGDFSDTLYAYVFYVYGSIKELFKYVLLSLFTKDMFTFVRKFKNDIEQK